jgi:hypothetical protein
MRLSFLPLAALLALLSAPAEAQTIWSRPYQPNQIALEALVPERPNANTSVGSAATFLTLTRSLNDNLELAAELPVARNDGTGSSTTAVGNPYVGLGLSSGTIPLLFEMGVRIPTVPTNSARSVGQRADVGRTAAFRDEDISVSALLNGRLPLGRRTSLRLRTGFTFASTDTSNTAATDEGRWQLPYSAQLWREGDRFLTGLSIVGRPSLTDSNVGEGRSTNRVVFSIMLSGERVQPGLFVGAGLDPLFEDGRFEWIGGLTLSLSYDR